MNQGQAIYIVASLLLASCVPKTPEPPAGTSFSMRLSRASQSKDIEVTVLATDINGAPLSGLELSLEASHAKEKHLLTDQGDGSYTGSIHPKKEDVEVEIIA